MNFLSEMLINEVTFGRGERCFYINEYLIFKLNKIKT